MPVYGQQIGGAPGTPAISLEEEIDKARGIVGAQIGEGTADIVPSDNQPIIDALEETIDHLAQLCGDSTVKREVPFDTVAGIQDYLINDLLGSGVETVDEVYRSSQHIPDNSPLLSPDIHPSTGLPHAYRPMDVEQGLEIEAFRSIMGGFRAMHHEDYEFDADVYKNGQRYLRLIPVPRSVEKCIADVTYKVSGIEALPSKARFALRHKICAILINLMLNRISRIPEQASQHPQLSQKRHELLERQRQRYEMAYETAAANIR